MKLTENSILVPPIARGQPAEFHALGHQVTIAGGREEFRERTTEADPGPPSVTLHERRSACVSEMIDLPSDPHESLGLLHRIRKLFAGLATGVEGRSDPTTNLPGAKTSSWSSVTTPSGPWVYTVVPWED